MGMACWLAEQSSFIWLGVIVWTDPVLDMGKSSLVFQGTTLILLHFNYTIFLNQMQGVYVIMLFLVKLGYD